MDIVDQLPPALLSELRSLRQATQAVTAYRGASLRASLTESEDAAILAERAHCESTTAHHHNHDEHAGHDAARLDDSRLSFPHAGHDAARLDESRLSFPRAIM